MLLESIHEENGFLTSRWHLTYPANWEMIVKAVYFVEPFYENTQILVEDKVADFNNRNEILNVEETGSMAIRGNSTIINHPISIRFCNQLTAVDVIVPMDMEEYCEADYKKLNMSLCQYLDSIELAMHRQF